MRSLQFAGLQRILHLVSEFEDGIRAGELNDEIVRRELYVTKGVLPAKTTLYHCRTALLHLGAMIRYGGRLTVNRDAPVVTGILDSPLPHDKKLSPTTREAFASLVLRNRDCCNGFFRFFLGHQSGVSPSDFRKTASPVVWKPIAGVDRERTSRKGKRKRKRKYQPVDYRSEILGEKITLASNVQIQAIHWGVRHWALQLELIGEFFETGRGSVMYPIRMPKSAKAVEAVLEELLSIRSDPGDWTTLSVHEMLNVCGEKRGYPVDTVFDGIRMLVKTYPGYVTLIPTIPNFAAIGATSAMRESVELTGYFTDSRGRLISHIRFHNTIREPEHGNSSKKVRQEKGGSTKD